MRSARPVLSNAVFALVIGLLARHGLAQTGAGLADRHRHRSKRRDRSRRTVTATNQATNVAYAGV